MPTEELFYEIAHQLSVQNRLAVIKELFKTQVCDVEEYAEMLKELDRELNEVRW